METGQYICIVVDDRESAGSVVAALQSRSQVRVRIERLPVGDYLIDDALLFERKTLPDLVASIKDGRLFRQGMRLAGSPLRAALILEGTAKDLAGNGMRREAIQGALLTLSLFFGLPLLRSMDPEETASLILCAARQGRAFATGALPRKGRRPRGKARIQSQILQGLPGVGPERAQRLLQRFGSIEAVVAASVAELAGVPGIGAKTALQIRQAVEEAPAHYAPAHAPDDLWPL